VDPKEQRKKILPVGRSSGSAQVTVTDAQIHSNPLALADGLAGWLGAWKKENWKVGGKVWGRSI
jgi:hypothetical protein